MALWACVGCSVVSSGKTESGDPVVVSTTPSGHFGSGSVTTRASFESEPGTTLWSIEGDRPLHEQASVLVSDLPGVLSTWPDEGVFRVTVAKDATEADVALAIQLLSSLGLNASVRESQVGLRDLEVVSRALPTIVLGEGQSITAGYDRDCDCIRIGTEVDLAGIIESWDIDPHLIVIVPETVSRLPLPQ